MRFVFGDAWQIERYDHGAQGPQGQSYYRNQISRLPNTKAVDLVGLLESEDTYLIEIKDFRHFRIENQRRISNGELALEVPHKVRDTLAGIMGASCNESPATLLSTTARLMIDRAKAVKIVLWLEDDLAGKGRQWAEELNTLITRLQTHLRWFTRRVLVVSQSTYANKPPQVTVTDVPRNPEP